MLTEPLNAEPDGTSPGPYKYGIKQIITPLSLKALRPICCRGLRQVPVHIHRPTCHGEIWRIQRASHAVVSAYWCGYRLHSAIRTESERHLAAPGWSRTAVVAQFQDPMGFSSVFSPSLHLSSVFLHDLFGSQSVHFWMGMVALIITPLAWLEAPKVALDSICKVYETHA